MKEFNVCKRILTFCLFGLIIVGLVLCFSLPFCSEIDLRFASLNIAPADTVNTDYYFTSSNIIVPVSAYSNVNNQTVYWNGYCGFQLNIPNNIDELCSVNFDFINFYGESIYNYERLYYFDITGSWEHFTTDIDDSPVSYVECSYYREVGFLPHIVSVTVSNVTSAWGGRAYSTELCYYDVNGKTLRVQVMRARTSALIPLTTRSYYFVDNFSSDNDFYQAGYDYGFSEGLSANQQNIYNSGFSAGKITGDSLGYQRGLAEANRFNFLTLAGAVIDAPIQAAMGLLNFDFLGFNLWNLAGGILTFAVIVRIVKLVLGGR